MALCCILILATLTLPATSAPQAQVPLFSSPETVRDHGPSLESARANAPQIFNAIHSSTRQWGSSLLHNGMSLYPARIPNNTHLYHGTHIPDAVKGMEWLAFEIEHAEMFARSHRIGPPRGRPGDPERPRRPGEPGDGRGPPPMEWDCAETLDEMTKLMRMSVNDGVMVNRVGLSRKHIFDAVDASIGRLGTYLDVLQIHRLDRETPREEIMKALNDVVESGKARYIGASSVSNSESQSCFHTKFPRWQHGSSKHFRISRNKMGGISSSACRTIIACSTVSQSERWLLTAKMLGLGSFLGLHLQEDSSLVHTRQNLLLARRRMCIVNF